MGTWKQEWSRAPRSTPLAERIALAILLGVYTAAILAGLLSCSGILPN